MSIPTLVTVVTAGVLLVLTTVLAIRWRGPAAGLSWAAIAGATQAMLGMGAAMQAPAGEGMRAGILQLIAVLLAATLAALCLTGRRTEGGEAREEPGDSLGRIGLGTAWLALVGLPPTLGFHSKALLYYSLLAAGWTGLAALVAAASVVCIVPAIWTLRSPQHFRPGRARTASVAALVGIIILLGLYPRLALSIAGSVAVAISGS